MRVIRRGTLSDRRRMIVCAMTDTTQDTDRMTAALTAAGLPTRYEPPRSHPELAALDAAIAALDRAAATLRAAREVLGTTLPR